MSFSDVIKKSVLDRFQTGDLTTANMAVTLAIAIVMGLFVYFVYRVNSKSGFYNRGFHKSLATLPVITAAIMLAMGSSLTISLGMVGALSIVRFRNAVKDPADLTYLFWSICCGIVVGAGLFELAALLSLAVALLVSVLDLLPTFRAPCLLVISGTNVELEQALMERIRQYSASVKVRSRNVSPKGTEWILELRVRKESELIGKLASMPGVDSVHLLTHDGDVRF